MFFISTIQFATAASRYWIATTTSTWNSTSNWSTSNGGSGGASVPGSSDDVYFTSSRNGNCTIDATVNINGIDIGGYSGTITNTTYAFTVSANNYFTQSSGTFNGGSSNITINARLSISGGTFNCGSGTVDINGTGFYLSGGTFTSTSGNMYVLSNWSHTTAGTFNHNNGTVIFDGATTNYQLLMVGGIETFYNFKIDKTSNGTVSLVTTNDKVIIVGTLTLSQGNFGSWNSNPVAIEAQGPVTILSGFGTVSQYATLSFTGTANQDFDLTSATNKIDGNITINKSSGQVNLLSSVVMDGAGVMNFTAGTLNLNGNSITITYGQPSICTGTFNLSGTGTLTNYGWSQTSGSPAFSISGSSTFAIGSGHFAMSTGTFNGGSATLDFNGNFNFTGGTFTGTSGTMYLSRDWAHSTAGTFTHNSGTIVFDGNFSSPPGKIQMVGNTETFYNLTFALVAGSQCIYTASDNIIVLGTLTLTTGSVSPWNGGNAVSIEARGDVLVTSGFGTFSSDVTLKFAGTTQALTMTGAESKLQGNFTISSTTNLNLASNVTMASGKTMTVSATGALNMNTYVISGAGGFTTSSGSKLRIGSTGGIASSGATGNVQVTGTRTFSTGCDYYFNGSNGAQVTGTGLPATVGIFSSSNTAGVTLQSNVSVSSSLQISGILDLGSYTINRSSSGGSMNLNAGGTLKIGGTNTVPSNYTTHSIDATSTVEYTGTTQTVAGLNSSQNYGNLTISATGAVTTNSFTVTGILTVNSSKSFIPSSGTITMNNGSSIVNSGTLTFSSLTLATSSTVTATGNFAVAGTFTISSGATFTPAASSIISGVGTLTGSGTAKVTRTAATADFNSQYTIASKTLTNLTIVLEGAASEIISGITYGNLTINNTNGVTLGGNTIINGTLTLTSGSVNYSSFSLTLGNGATIILTGGTLPSAPVFGTSVNVSYPSHTTSRTTSFEIPTSSTVLNNLSIANTNGINLGSSPTINGTLTLGGGNFSLGTFNLIMASGSSLSGGSSSTFIYTGSTGQFKYLNCVASSTRTFPVGHTNSSAGYVPLVITFNSGHTTDDFGVVAYNLVTNDGTRTGSAYTTAVVKTTWNISETVSGGSNINLQFQWNGTDEGSTFNRASCQMAHYTSSWGNVGSLGSASGSNPYTFTYSNYTGTFSPFGINGNGGPLPVSLLYFDAKKINNLGNLLWATASETNNDFFIIEKSKDDRIYYSIGKITGTGNSQQIIKYEFVDSNLCGGINYYRLKQIDYDGKVYSSAKTFIQNEFPQSEINIWPVPATNQITIEFKNTNRFNNFVITDFLGLIVQKGEITPSNQSVNLSINLINLKSGQYYLLLKNNFGSYVVKSFSIIR
ncbi:MAG: T9SS type A sorting domain-containing protein [Bacteroidia bacterium]